MPERARQRARTEGEKGLTTRCQRGTRFEDGDRARVDLAGERGVEHDDKHGLGGENQNCSFLSMKALFSNVNAHPRRASVRTKSAPSPMPGDGWSVLLDALFH